MFKQNKILKQKNISRVYSRSRWLFMAGVPESQHEEIAQLAQGHGALKGLENLLNFTIKIKKGDTLYKKIFEEIKKKTNSNDKKFTGFKGQEKGVTFFVLKHMAGDKKGQRGFDINRVEIGDEFKFAGKSVTKTSYNIKTGQGEVKETAEFGFEAPAGEARANLGKLKKEITKEQLDTKIGQGNLSNVRRLVGLSTKFSERKADWDKVGGGIEGSKKAAPKDWIASNFAAVKAFLTANAEKFGIKINQINSAQDIIKNKYRGTALQNLAYCLYYKQVEQAAGTKTDQVGTQEVKTDSEKAQAALDSITSLPPTEVNELIAVPTVAGGGAVELSPTKFSQAGEYNVQVFVKVGSETKSKILTINIVAASAIESPAVDE